MRNPWVLLKKWFDRKPNELLLALIKSRPRTVKIAAWAMVANVFVLTLTSTARWQQGSLSFSDYRWIMLDYLLLLIFPWRICKGGWYSRVLWIFLIATSVAPVIFGVIPEELWQRVVMFGLALPLQIASVWLLVVPSATRWFLDVQEVKKN